MRPPHPAARPRLVSDARTAARTARPSSPPFAPRRPAPATTVALGAALAVSLVATPRAADARVVRAVVERRTVLAGGAAFGAAGAYERLEGRLLYAWDPAHPANRRITDLARAPRNARGEVEAWGTFTLLRPVDPARGSGTTLVDVVNRGGMTTRVFSLGVRADASPDSAAHYGDALPLRRGMSVLLVGWQWDVTPTGGAQQFHPPVACATLTRRRDACATALTGLVRSDVTVDAPTRVVPLGHRVGASQAVGYPVADPRDPTAVLTVRDGPRAPRTVIPRDRWRFAREDSAGAVVEDARHAYLPDGFEAGRIYEVVYTARDPLVVGTGLLAVRDAIAWLKHDPASLAPTRRGIAYGVSQTGRFLRHFLYEGLNADERGRAAYDGIFAHTAGAGRGSFNHRFAQPSRDAQPYSTFDYPTDVFPFTSVDVTDPVTGARGGLRTRVTGAPAPKVFYVDGGYEYWGRAASLAHTTPDGTADVPLLASERRYALSSAQHSGPAGFPLPASARLPGDSTTVAAWRGDPLDQRLALRALLVALADWVARDAAPPPSTHPTRAAGLLVPADSVAYPALPGVRIARIPVTPVRLDFGPRWSREGIVDREPPATGAPFRVLVPRPDSLGNELGGIRAVELRVPLATYLPWQLRAPALAGSDRLTSFAGTTVPLPLTEAARARTGDGRPSVERLHGSREAFLAAVDRAAAGLVAERFLLPEDVAAARARMAATWGWVHEVGAR